MIADSVGKIRERIDLACRRAGRDPSEVRLLAVSKTFPAESVREVVSSGICDIGENYVQELRVKREQLADDRIRWHFIGHLQTNKVKYVADWVHLIHAVDSARLAAEIDKHAARAGRKIDLLVEVNSTGEESKYGVPPGETEALVKELARFDNIRVCGLMTMSLFDPDPEVSRPVYRGLRQIRDNLAGLRQENLKLKHLSMGMTGDFEVAIEEGATIVRIGTALFGKRQRR
ncbi:MAG: YggS family pyridoxal phosphate-dependent enzyme [Ignavibacteria bacterium]|nr:YggS family pyridoxal phosphate-dependent enzyme [Ignavibacteria bacterium]